MDNTTFVYTIDYDMCDGLYEWKDGRYKFTADFHRLKIFTERMQEFLEEKTGKKVPLRSTIELNKEEFDEVRNHIKEDKGFIGLYGAYSVKAKDIVRLNRPYGQTALQRRKNCITITSGVNYNTCICEKKIGTMKKWFVMKDGEVVGNPLGYKTEKAAKNYISKCDDLYDQWFEYSQVKYGKYNGAKEIPEELKDGGMFVYQYSMSGYLGMSTSEGWFISYPAWEKNVWKPYVKEHYEVRERNYRIVFDD